MDLWNWLYTPRRTKIGPTEFFDALDPQLENLWSTQPYSAPPTLIFQGIGVIVLDRLVFNKRIGHSYAARDAVTSKTFLYL